jgi:hypothetical protein
VQYNIIILNNKMKLKDNKIAPVPLTGGNVVEIPETAHWFWN